MTDNENGFTLIEVLVVTGIVAVLSVFAAGIFIANNRFYLNQSAEIQAVVGTWQSGDRINEYGRTAAAFVASRIYNSTTYTTGAETVIFQIPSINASQQIIASTYDYVYITKDLSNISRLILIVEPNAASARLARSVELTNKLSVVSFTYDNGSPSQASNMTYRIKIDTGGRYPGVEDLRGGVTLRNK